MTYKKVQAAARRCGLHVFRYNPGDNMTYKVTTSAAAGYFEASSSQTLLRAKKLSTVRKFLAKRGCDVMHTKRRR